MYVDGARVMREKCQQHTGAGAGAGAGADAGTGAGAGADDFLSWM